MFADLWYRISGEWDRESAELLFKQTAANLFFQRYIIMALNDPCGYGLMPDYPNGKLHNKLTSISLVLGRLSNGMAFGEEERYMMQFNQFILDRIPFIVELYAILSNGTLPQKAKSENIKLPHDLKRKNLSIFDELLSSL